MCICIYVYIKYKYVYKLNRWKLTNTLERKNR